MSEIAEVMERYGEVSRNFVLAEADPADLEAGPEADRGGALLMDEAAPGDLEMAMDAPRRKVCIRFGIDPRTGRRICLQWVDAR